jgi:hypothetical protein
VVGGCDGRGVGRGFGGTVITQVGRGCGTFVGTGRTVAGLVADGTGTGLPVAVGTGTGFRVGVAVILEASATFFTPW